ncbi:MAG: hypothetical protein KKC46_04845 [Proteobacteria bacterium]|nr:hypothetical protein [Pseudomonadota bacterium]
MNSILKYCIILGSLLIFFPVFVQAETLFSDNKSQTDILRTENAELKAEITTLKRELADSKYLHALSKRTLKQFKDTSAEYTELEAKYNETAENLTKQNKKVGVLEDEVANLLRQKNIMWFFSGVGVFLLGFLIGYSARREKRKSLL